MINAKLINTGFHCIIWKFIFFNLGWLSMEWAKCTISNGCWHHVPVCAMHANAIQIAILPLAFHLVLFTDLHQYLAQFIGVLWVQWPILVTLVDDCTGSGIGHARPCLTAGELHQKVHQKLFMGARGRVTLLFIVGYWFIRNTVQGKHDSFLYFEHVFFLQPEGYIGWQMLVHYCHVYETRVPSSVHTF